MRNSTACKYTTAVRIVRFREIKKYYKCVVLLSIEKKQ